MSEITPPSAHATKPHAALVASDWVQRWAHLVPVGAKVLDVACGLGRHMAYFQQRGCLPTGIDRDAQALAASSTYGQTILADIENGPWPVPAQSFDVLLVTHYLWRTLFPVMLGALRPGGLLIYETFAHGNQTVGRPARPEFLLQPGELLRVCEGYEVIAYENGFLTQPDRFIQRICAVKPHSSHATDLQKRPLLSLECGKPSN